MPYYVVFVHALSCYAFLKTVFHFLVVSRLASYAMLRCALSYSVMLYIMHSSCDPFSRCMTIVTGRRARATKSKTRIERRDWDWSGLRQLRKQNHSRQGRWGTECVPPDPGKRARQTSDTLWTRPSPGHLQWSHSLRHVHSYMHTEKFEAGKCFFFSSFFLLNKSDENY